MLAHSTAIRRATFRCAVFYSQTHQTIIHADHENAIAPRTSTMRIDRQVRIRPTRRNDYDQHRGYGVGKTQAAVKRRGFHGCTGRHERKRSGDRL
jgi:hypothetical protein